MKKVLFSFLLSMAVFWGKSQIILNEVYSEPDPSRNEFFELYNTNVNGSGVQLDCYTLVTYWKTSNTDSGFFVLDLPDIGMINKRYYVGASAININVQGAAATADFNWNNLGSTGYLRKYKVTQTNGVKTLTLIAPFPSADQNNIFQPVQGVGDIAVFLFKQGVYVNGLIVGFNTNPPTSVPSQILNMPKLTVDYVSSATSSCNGSFDIDWKTITQAEFSTGGGSGGTDNGFARASDGNCGSWVKTANSPNHTPGLANLPGNSTVTPLIQTGEKRICGSQIDYQITNATYQTVFPVTVQLFADINGDGLLDANDSNSPVYENQIGFASNNLYSITNLDPNSKYFLIYKTALGCYDKITTPSPLTIDLITTQKNICNQIIDFTIGTPTVAAETYSYYTLPIEVLLFDDVNQDGILNEDTTNKQNLITEALITSLPVSDALTIPSSALNKKFILVYKAAYGCYSKIGQLTNVTGNLITSQTNICGKRIDFTITDGSNIDIRNYTLNKDVTVQLFIDGMFSGTQKTITLTNFPFSSTLSVPTDLSPINSNKKVELVYTPFYSCFSTTATAPYTMATLSVTGSINCTPNANNKRTVTYSLQSVSDIVAYPITLTCVEDNGTPDDISDDLPVGTPHEITEPSALQFTEELTNSKSNVTIKAESAVVGCATTSLIVPNSCIVLPVKFQSFTAVRNKQKKEQVLLKWETASEQNNRGFYIQRKTSGEWKNIAFVFSQSDKGNSNSTLVYEYKETNTSRGVTQYQLQQVDIDGKTSYSDIKAVLGMEEKGSVRIYPNPSQNGKVNLLFSEQDAVRDVIVSDMSGRVVKQFRQVRDSNLEIEGLQSGFYTIKITNRSSSATTVEKVIIK